MDSIWLWPLALLAVLFALPALRDLAARLAVNHYRPQVREGAPDYISLVRVREPRWRNARAIAVADYELYAAGFAEAGTYLVHQMPELTIGLYALPGECAYAVIYDHPTSGFWAELVTRYHDDSIANYTTLEPMDVEVPAGSLHVAAPELSLGELWKRMLSERPTKPMRQCSRAAAAQDFERAYAESVARHKFAERQRVDPLVGVPTDESVALPVAMPVALPVLQPGEQPGAQPLERPVALPVPRPVEQLVAKLVPQPAPQQTELPLGASRVPPDEELREAA